ncbi:MAG: hypothetical protein AB7O62_06200 [Pirellulales bacterium]
MVVPSGEPAPSTPARRRVVLLGASNLTRGLATVVEQAQATWNEPLEILAAPGHGRSYGVQSRVFVRSLPGILECGLWPALNQSATGGKPASTVALVTDIGNDILYGRPVATISAWVEECLDRLARHGARTVLTLLPLVNLDRLSLATFLLLRRVMFPSSRLTLPQTIDRARQLDERLRALGTARGLAMIEPRGAWYGFDPIHLRRRAWREAWREILLPWSDDAPAREAKKFFVPRALNLLRLPPEQRWLCGMPQRRAQPVLRQADGTTLSLY